MNTDYRVSIHLSGEPKISPILQIYRFQLALYGSIHSTDCHQRPTDLWRQRSSDNN